MLPPISNNVPYAPPGLPLPQLIEKRLLWFVHTMLQIIIPAIHEGRATFTEPERSFKDLQIINAKCEHPIFQKTLFLYFRLTCMNYYHCMQLPPSQEFLRALDTLCWSPTVFDALQEALYLHRNTPNLPLIDQMICLEKRSSL